MSESLEVLFPTGKDVTVGDETITIKPFKAGQLPRVMKAAQPIYQTLAVAFATEKTQGELIVMLLGDGGEHLLDIAAISCNKPRSWIDDLDADKLIELIGVVVEINASFFVRKVAPAISQAMKAATAQTGQTSS